MYNYLSLIVKYEMSFGEATQKKPQTSVAEGVACSLRLIVIFSFLASKMPNDNQERRAIFIADTVTRIGLCYYRFA